MEDQVWLYALFIVDGLPYWLDGMFPLAMENMDSCLQSVDSLVDYVQTYVAPSVGPDEVLYGCGTRPEIEALIESYKN